MNIFNYRKCAVVILWVEGKIMLCRRKTGKFEGHFGCAGGKIEKNEDILDGVRREFFEETGAYLYAGGVKLIDCYVIPKAEQKIFIFENVQPEFFKVNIQDTEPDKHSPWIFYTKKEALKLNLMPYIREYLENIDPSKLKVLH